MLQELQVGPQVATDGTRVVARGGRLGEAIFTELQPRYAEAARTGRLCFATTLLRAMSLASTTSQVGLIVQNPAGSGVNLALTKWAVGQVVTTAASTGFVLSYTYQATDVTGVTVADAWGQSLLAPGATATTGIRPGIAKAAAIATTLANPVPIYWLANNTVAIATTGAFAVQGDFEGSIIVPPGGIVTINTTGAAGAASSTNASLQWFEIPA